MLGIRSNLRNLKFANALDECAKAERVNNHRGVFALANLRAGDVGHRFTFGGFSWDFTAEYFGSGFLSAGFSG
jgi:hypothetical protein